jgi:hypothetical protein
MARVADDSHPDSVSRMAETVLCPQCRQRLRLPESCRDQLVQCPSCKAEFASTEALPEFTPLSAAPPPPPPRPLPPHRDPDRQRDDRDHRRRDDWDFPPRSRWNRRDDERRPPRRSPWRRLGLLAVIIGVIALLAGTAYWIIPSRFKPRNSSGQSQVARAPEDAKERQQDVKDAFADAKVVPAEEVAAELAPLFDRLGAGLRAADQNRIVAEFDPDRMSDEMIAQGATVLDDEKMRRSFAQGVRQGLGVGLARRAPALSWTASTIKHVRKLSDDDMWSSSATTQTTMRH